MSSIKAVYIQSTNNTKHLNIKLNSNNHVSIDSGKFDPVVTIHDITIDEITHLMNMLEQAINEAVDIEIIMMGKIANISDCKQG